MFDWIPNVHPIVVHFPIALLIAAVVADIAGFVTRGRTDAAATWLYLGGTVGVIAAFLSGRAAVDSLLIPASAQAIQTDHADWALTTMIVFIALTVVRIALLQIGKPSVVTVRALSVVAGVVGAGLLAITGDLGGRMVFAHGVGVSQPEQDMEVREAVSDAVGPGAVLGYAFQAVTDDFRQAILGADSTVLNLYLDRDELQFVTVEDFGSVQAEVELNLDRFKGRASLLYGFVSDDETDYIEFDQGTVEQGRRSAEGSDSFDQKVLTPSGWFKVTAVTDDTHFRGYVDEALVVHGHGDPSSEGAIGLRLDGSGLVQVRNLTIQSLR